MAVSETVISAYLRIYNAEEIRVALALALNDRASGVMVTQISFSEGGGSGQVMSGDPNEIIEILEHCMRRIDNPAAAAPVPMASVMNFSKRRSET